MGYIKQELSYSVNQNYSSFFYCFLYLHKIPIRGIMSYKNGGECAMEIENKNILNRLKRTEGQIRGIQKMIEDEKECMDVITQLSAVRSSIDRVMGMIVADNLKNCFENPDSNPEEQAAKLEQAIKMIIKK